MVKLRLRRMGRKKAPIYKIVAADSRSRRDGKFIEALGQYDPNFHPAKIELKEDRAMYWLKSGAQPTLTVKNIFSNNGLLLKFHLTKKGFDENKINAEFSKWQEAHERKLQKKLDRKLKLKDKKKKQAAKQHDEQNVPAGEQANA